MVRHKLKGKLIQQVPVAFDQVSAGSSGAAKRHRRIAMGAPHHYHPTQLPSSVPVPVRPWGLAKTAEVRVALGRNPFGLLVQTCFHEAAVVRLFLAAENQSNALLVFGS